MPTSLRNCWLVWPGSLLCYALMVVLQGIYHACDRAGDGAHEQMRRHQHDQAGRTLVGVVIAADAIADAAVLVVAQQPLLFIECVQCHLVAVEKLMATMEAARAVAFDED